MTGIIKIIKPAIIIKEQLKSTFEELLKSAEYNQLRKIR
jgi:3-deoxy-D-arabino-heptulosonate 7-phosphate (DAHP) synthase